jgi:hypothetical protein
VGAWPLSFDRCHRLIPRRHASANATRVSASTPGGISGKGQPGKEDAMYIGGGVLALIIIVVLLIWLL